MARAGVNKVILIGNLGADPEIRHTPDNVAVATIRLATTERFKDRGGTWQEKTEWHRVVLWRGLAEIAEQYLRKGSTVYIEGRLETRSWEDKTGQKRYTTEVIATDMTMLDARAQGAAAGDDSVAPAAERDGGLSPAKGKERTGAVEEADDSSDDLPF